MRLPLFLTILLILLLAGCNDDTPATPSSKAAEAARIEREVARRVSAARLESAVRTSRLRTIRVVGFIVLAGGAVVGLVWLRSRRFPDLTALPPPRDQGSVVGRPLSVRQRPGDRLPRPTAKPGTRPTAPSPTPTHPP